MVGAVSAREKNRKYILYEEVFVEVEDDNNKHCDGVCRLDSKRSAAEAVESSALSLESVDDIDGGDRLSLGVFGVGDGVTDDVLEESSQDEAGLVVDERRDSLDTTASGESADGRLGDAHDGGLEGGLGASLSAGLAGNLAELAALGSVYGTHNDY